MPTKTLQGPDTFVPLKLEKRIKLSRDTFIFRFELPSSDHILGLPIGQNIQVGAEINGEQVIRAYTPVTSDDDLGHLDLIIKVYFKNIHPSFPDGGKVSQYIHNLKIGQTLNIRGPTGRLLYHGKGEFGTRPDKVSDYTNVKVNKVNMIAGGSGITPMLQIIKAILKDSDDYTMISLIFANQTEGDILCREDLEKIREEKPHRFKLWYTVDKAPADWKFGSGFITAEMMKSHLYPPSDKTITLMCGPPPMLEYACKPNLKQLGYDEKLCHAY
jgi:cytochrome-b5 reductase